MTEGRKSNIFREEAINYQRQRWTGKALLISGMPSYAVALACFFFISLLAAVLYFCEYTRRIDVAGEVISIPHATNIFSPQYGFVVKSYFNPGDTVKKGDPLYILDVSRTTTNGNVSSSSADEIMKQIEQLGSISSKLKDNKSAMLNTLTQQISGYSVAYDETKNLVASAKDAMKKMNDGMKSYEIYLNKGLITKDQLNYQRSLFNQQLGSYQSLSSQLIQQRIQLTQLNSDRLTRAAEYDNQISQNESQRSELQRQLVDSNASGKIIISSPLDGKIESLSATPGQTVDIGSSLAQIKPTGEIKYYLVLWVPNNSLPYIKKDDGINIRYEAFPSDKFGQFTGKIKTISSIPASTQEMSSYSSGKNSNQLGHYKVIASINDIEFSDKGKKLEITSGLQANVIVFLEKKPLYLWVISPMQNIKNSVVGQIDG